MNTEKWAIAFTVLPLTTVLNNKKETLTTSNTLQQWVTDRNNQ